MRNKVTAGLLGILLGSIGAHKFYLGKTVQGLLYLCFCWTGLTTIVGFIEGIRYLTLTNDEFNSHYNARFLPPPMDEPETFGGPPARRSHQPQQIAQSVTINIPDGALPKSQVNARSVTDELIKLNELRLAGVLTDDEFAKQKAKLLDG